MPKRSRNGDVSSPARVVAPTSVNGGRSILIERAARPLADHDVELEVFQRGVEDFLDDRAQPVDLVDEQDFVRLQVREQRGEIARALEHRSRRLLETHAEFVGDHVRERGLAQTGRTEDQGVVERLAALAGGGDEDFHLRFHRGLAHVIGECLRPHRAVVDFFFALAGGGYDAIGFYRHGQSWRVSRWSRAARGG